MKTNTLYVSDLDGTLLSTDSRISERSAEIITSLTEQGALITVATARTPATVVPLLAATATTPPAVVMTGCAFWDRKAARLVNPHYIPATEVALALDVCARHGVHPFVFVMSDDGNVLDVYHDGKSLNKSERSFYEERAHVALKRFHLGTPAPERAFTHSVLFYAMGENVEVRLAAQELQTISNCTVCSYPDIFNPNIYNLEVFPPGVNKAAAVLELKQQLGADRLVVFGDSLNDLSMLAVADLAVAVGNALPEVKDAADIVIEPNYTDSVARFIEADFFA